MLTIEDVPSRTIELLRACIRFYRFFCEVYHELRALLVTSSPHSTSESPCTIAIERDNEESLHITDSCVLFPMVFISESRVRWTLSTPTYYEGRRLENIIILLGDQQPRKPSGHPFELDAPRHQGHQGKTPIRLRMDFTFASKTCDHGRVRDLGYHAENCIPTRDFFGGWATESSVVRE
jgi:hypothetical protein